MNAFFAPAVGLMNRLDYGRKFALLGTMSLVAIALLAGGLYLELNAHIHTARHEVEGLRLVAPVTRAVQLTQQHRGLSATVLSGGEAMRDELIRINREANEAYLTLDGMLPASLRAGADWQAIMAGWRPLHGALLQGPLAENFDAHTRLVNKLQGLIELIADDYALTLDPEFDTYYLIDTVTNRLPDALEHFGQLRAKGSSALVRKRIDEQQKLELYGTMEKLLDALVSLKADLEKTGRYNPELQKAHAAVSSDIAASTQRVMETLMTDVIMERFATSPQAFFAMCTEAIDADYAKMYEVLLPTAEKLLEQRVAEARRVLYLVIGAALLIFLVVSYFSLGISRAVAGSVRTFARSATAFAGGKLDERVHLDTHDELRRVGDSFNEMADGFNAMLKARGEAEEALLRSNADLMRFAEVSAHHLMEPVRRLSVYSQRLRARLDGLPQGGDEEVANALETIGRDAAHLRILVRDIQLYLAAGEARGEVMATDADAVLEALKERLAPMLTESGASIETDPLPPAMLDRPRLTDLFAVLLDNALHHGRPADPGVRQHIVVSGARKERCSRYFVRDNGPGIPAQYRERVFEIFERLAPGGGDAGSGSGIGLAIARRIVESRGGKIWLENSLEGGTTVVFELPDGDGNAERKSQSV